MSLKDALPDDTPPAHYQCECGEARFRLWENGAVTCAGCEKEVPEVKVIPND